MSRLWGLGLRAGLLLLLIVGAFVADAAPASAALGGGGGSHSGTCVPVNDTRVPGGTRIDCGSGFDQNGECATVQNGIKTCSVRRLGNGLEFFALATSVAGLFVSAILWALGSKGENPGQELTGKRGVIICLMAALLVGGFPAINAFWDKEATTSSFDKTGVTKAAPPTIVITPPAAGVGVGGTGLSTTNGGSSSGPVGIARGGVPTK